jgi:putative flippase GtrA
MIVRTGPNAVAGRTYVTVLTQRAFGFLMSPAARALRFVVSGSISALGQFLVLALLLDLGWNRFPANLAGMAFGAEMSFVLGCLLTWRDREETGDLRRRWIVFHGSIAATALVNILVFSVCQLYAPTIVASALGIGVAAIGNFVAGDRLVFRASVAGQTASNPAVS